MLITYDQLMGVKNTLELIGVNLTNRGQDPIYYIPQEELWFMKPHRTFLTAQPIDSIWWGYGETINIIFGQYRSMLFNTNDFIFVNTSKESVERELQNYRLLG